MASINEFDHSLHNYYDDDDELVALGYQPSFKREFTNLATVLIMVFCDLTLTLIMILNQISFAFSIMVRTVV